jgi:hypothetical protein
MAPLVAVTVLAVVAQLGSTPQPFRFADKRMVLWQQLPSPHILMGRAAAAIHQTPQVLCTMPMIRPQTDVDPKIVVETPNDAGQRFKMRTIDAPRCVERTSR